MSLDLKVCDPQKNKLLEETSSSTAGKESNELKQLSQGAAHMVAALGDWEAQPGLMLQEGVWGKEMACSIFYPLLTLFSEFVLAVKTPTVTESIPIATILERRLAKPWPTLLNFILSSCNPFNQGKHKQRVQTVYSSPYFMFKSKKKGTNIKMFPHK